MGPRHCAGCGHRASAHARFCERCGAALTPGARPLRAPGLLEAQILEQRPTIEGERKQVTVMYTDIVGSMELTRALEAERWGFVLDRFLAIAAGAVHAFEGTVNQFTGDGLLAVFGAPLAHEDHARRACLTVLELQREVAALAALLTRSDGVEFAVRCGLNSGEVVVGEIGDDVHMDFVPIGNTTALGKRIESLAPVGSTAISESTAALVEGEFELRELGEFEVKGADGPQRVLELVGPGMPQTRLQAVAATRGLSRFVGRDAERAELESALERALAGNGRAVGIVGDAGVGKSRLVHEFVAGCAARGQTAVTTGGVAHGRDIPLLPVLGMYRGFFGVTERDPAALVRERIENKLLGLDPTFAEDVPVLFEVLGVSDPDRPATALGPQALHRRLMAFIDRAVAARDRSEPMVLVLEDLHWFDDASLAYYERLAARIVGTRTLLIATYRPGYAPAWAGVGPHAQLRLGPLDAAATRDLLTGLLGRDGSLDAPAALVETRAAGNPFFVEELVQALVEHGHLDGGRGGYRLMAEVEDVVLPPTVQAALDARIDRLPPREKALVQTMSVIGKEIPGPLLSAVSDLCETELAQAVQALADGQWVIPDDLTGSREYAFKHPLTQEVAYRSQLSARRARAHSAVATAIERTYPDRLDERAALLAHHYEAAGEHLRGARWHARAASWAEGTSPANGMRHWRRVRRLVGAMPASSARDELAMRARLGILSLAWRLGIEPEETTTVYAESGPDTERIPLDLYYAGSLLHRGCEREGLDGFRAASRQALAGGDAGSVLTAATGVAYASWIAGSLDEAARTIDQAFALAGDDPGAGSGLVFVCPLAQALGDRGQLLGYAGELDAGRRALHRAIDLARERNDPETESAALGKLALLEAEVGDLDAAHSAAARGLALAQRTGSAVHIIACSTPGAVAQAGAGSFAGALVQAEANLATIREHRIGLYYEPLLLATIARSALGLGRLDDALAAAEEAVEIADARGLATCALSAPLVLAQVLLAVRGRAAGERINTVLVRALGRARESGAHTFEQSIRRKLVVPAR